MTDEMPADAVLASELLNVVLKAAVAASDVINNLKDKEQTNAVKLKELEALRAVLEALSLGTDYVNRINDGIDAKR